jgi:hypothetical protein
MSHLTVSPAYGRDYKSGKAARADWDANKDFVIQSMSFQGSYVNKGQSEELLDAGISEVMIRFKRMENFVLVKLDDSQCRHIRAGERCAKKKGHKGGHSEDPTRDFGDCLNPLCTKGRGHGGACAG